MNRRSLWQVITSLTLSDKAYYQSTQMHEANKRQTMYIAVGQYLKDRQNVLATAKAQHYSRLCGVRALTTRVGLCSGSDACGLAVSRSTLRYVAVVYNCARKSSFDTRNAVSRDDTNWLSSTTVSIGRVSRSEIRGQVTCVTPATSAAYRLHH